MNTTDIIYSAIESIKQEYKPAKHMHIDELTNDNEVISLSVSGIEEGYESDTLEILLDVLGNLFSDVSSSFGDKIGHFCLVGNDNNNCVSYNTKKQTVTYKAFAWNEKVKCVGYDVENYAESNSKDAAAIISELFSTEELEDENNFAAVCKKLHDIILDSAEPIKDEEYKKEFISLSMRIALEKIYGHLSVNFNFYCYEKALPTMCGVMNILME